MRRRTSVDVKKSDVPKLNQKGEGDVGASKKQMRTPRPQKLKGAR